MTDLFRLDEEVALLTGALGRLGSMWAEALLESGAAVIGIDLQDVPISDSFRVLEKQFPKQLTLYRANILDRSEGQELLSRALREIGAPGILVNNAGIDQPPSKISSYALDDIPLELCRTIFDVNVLGAFQMMQVVGKEMVKRGKGSIINIGSLYASVSPDARFYDHIDCEPKFLKPPAYGASKAALINLTKYFAAHWGSTGVRVNALSPGGVLGGQDEAFLKKFCDRVPLKRMADKRDLKGPLLFLASPASSYVTGIELKVDGGFTLW